MIKKCAVCGREFQARRSTARYCSATCRSRAYRGYEFTGELAAPEPCVQMNVEDVAEVVRHAHEAASDLSRASLMATAPLCLSLRKASEKMEDALRGEGL